MKKRVQGGLPCAVCLALLLIWEVYVRAAGVPSYVLPAPTQVLAALVTDWANLLGHSVVTVAEALSGMALALLLALLLGVAMDAQPLVKRCLYPILVVTQTVPMIVLAPILIIYLGFGLAPKILTVVLMCFFPIAVSFVDGMAQIAPEYVNLVRSYGARGPLIYRLVKVPAAMPSLISGLKVAATYSISGAVVGEWIASQSGLGYYLLRVKNSYALDKMFACVLVVVILSLMMNGLVRLVKFFSVVHLRKREV